MTTDATYRTDPHWQAAQDAYVTEDYTDTSEDVTFARRVLAALDMYHVEQEYTRTAKAAETV